MLTAPVRGNQIDHYLLEKLISTGLTASTYRGTDLRSGRRVAIKIPRAGIQDDRILSQRFRLEYEIGRKLDHPSLVRFITDEARSGAYVVTEWVEGQSLRRILNEQTKIPRERTIRIGMGICEALEYIHSRGIVHRDLKPENIIVGADDHVTLMDFGVATLANARYITFGKASQIVGTPDYVSPEQVSGKRGDARSDIYAAGIILYEMLTGATPFAGDNPFALMNSRLFSDPIPPRELNPDISIALQEVLYRALERNPQNRYAKAHELAWDLQHPDRIQPEDRPELHNWHRRQTSPLLKYCGMAAMILLIFALLLMAARHG